jgi:hypothetical protein
MAAAAEIHFAVLWWDGLLVRKVPNSDHTQMGEDIYRYVSVWRPRSEEGWYVKDAEELEKGKGPEKR